MEFTTTSERFYHSEQIGTRACGMDHEKSLLIRQDHGDVRRRASLETPGRSFRGKPLQSRLERSITWNTTNGLGSAWAVCESPKSKFKRMRPSHLKKQKPYCSARQSGNPVFGQEQRQSTC